MPLYYLLVVVAGILSGLLFWDVYKVMNPEPLLMPEIKAQDVSPVTSVVWGSWLDPVKSNPPVKEIPKEPEEKPKRQIDVNVNLVGLFGGRVSGVAIMSVDGKTHQVYAVGDPVKDDIELAEIRLNSILLKVDDVEKEYAMNKAESIIQEVNSNLQSLDSPQPSATQPVVVPNKQNSLQIQQQPERQSFIPVTPKVRKKISSVRQQVKEKPLSVLGLGKFKLTRSKGQLGIQVSSFKYRDVLLGLGLRLNDIVVSVNGKSIQEITKNPRLANSLLELKNFDVVLIRNGRKISVPIQW